MDPGPCNEASPESATARASLHVYAPLATHDPQGVCVSDTGAHVAAGPLIIVANFEKRLTLVEDIVVVLGSRSTYAHNEYAKKSDMLIVGV